MNDASYYIVIPSEVRKDNRLSMTERVIFGEILGLTNISGVCFAKNKTFADIYGLSERQISASISRLFELGYIKITTNGCDRTIEVNFLGMGVVGEKPLTSKNKTSNVYINNTSNNTLYSSKAVALQTDVNKKEDKMPRHWLPTVLEVYGNAQGWSEKPNQAAYGRFAKACKDLFLVSGGDLEKVKYVIGWVKSQKYPSWSLDTCVKRWYDATKKTKEDLIPDL